MVPDKIADLADQVLDGRFVTREQADWLAGLDHCRLHDLFRAATRIREHFLGNTVRCCSIVSAKTGKCGEDCAFCSQSAHFSTHVTKLTEIETDRICEAAIKAAHDGADSFGLVNSGYGPSDAEVERWGGVMQRIRQAGHTRTCGCMGVLSAEQAKRLAEMGMQRYNHNLQTSRRFFTSITTTHGYDDRLTTLRHLKAVGVSLCSGALFGMGESWADRLDLAFELRELGVDVVPINFLIPIEGTPLANAEPLEPMECLKIIAVYRFCLPAKHIKIAGGRERNLRDLQSWIFHAGADGFLIGNYLTTYGRPPEEDRQMVRDLGLTLAGYREHANSMANAPGRDRGDRPVAKLSSHYV